jgi:surface antigen
MKSFRNIVLGAALVATLSGVSTAQAGSFGSMREFGFEDVASRRRVRRNTGNAVAGAILGAAIVGGIAAIAASEQRRSERRAYQRAYGYDAYGRPVYAQPQYVEDEGYYAPQQRYYAPQPGYYAPQPGYGYGRPGYIGGPGYERRLRSAIPSNDPSLSPR